MQYGILKIEHHQVGKNLEIIIQPLVFGPTMTNFTSSLSHIHGDNYEIRIIFNKVTWTFQLLVTTILSFHIF